MTSLWSSGSVARGVGSSVVQMVQLVLTTCFLGFSHEIPSTFTFGMCDGTGPRMHTCRYMLELTAGALCM
jgi:hypothetical protein